MDIANQLVDPWAVLSDLKLGESWERHPNRECEVRAAARQRSPRDFYAYLVANRAYDFMLKDRSLFAFRAWPETEGFGLAYAYYEPPEAGDDYLTFVSMQGFDPDEVGDALSEEYEQYVAECELRLATTPIRYDYSESAYRAGVHPASHFHIGSQNEVRLASQRILKPISFVLFVLRHCYPDAWSAYLQDGETRSKAARAIRDELDAVPREYWSAMDQIEAWLA